jgi:hypothetical protein
MKSGRGRGRGWPVAGRPAESDGDAGEELLAAARYLDRIS